MIQLSFFGQPRIQIEDQPFNLKARKGLALLAFLAVVESRRQSRDVLAALLWPDYDQVRARTNLRRLLYLLNQTPVADWLETDSDFISLRLDENREVDVLQFEALLEQETPEALAEAVTLYQDDFLADFYLSDSSSFEEWTIAQRQLYQRQMLNALHTLTDHYQEKEAFSAAETSARRQLQHDNFRESAWRQLMIALAAQDRRAEALAVYEECRQLLEDELDVEPSAATVALVEELRAGEWEQKIETTRERVVTLDRPSVHMVARPSPYRGLFAFREEDAPNFFGREEFTELLVTAVHDQAIVAVIGPSGSGKSSVVNAGLVAQVRPTPHWRIASFRPEVRPFYALAEALIPHLEPNLSKTDALVEVQKLTSALSQAEVKLFDVVKRILHNGHDRFLLIADQFEELYTLCPDPELRHQFLDVLLEPVFMQLYRPAPVFNLVLTLRADFAGQALAYRPLADAIQESDVKLGPMSRPELLRAIVNPAVTNGADFEAGLSARMLDDVGEEPGKLPLLQFAMASLWERRRGDSLTHEAYEAIGTVEGALSQYAEDVFASLKGDDREAARHIFIQLVRPGEGTEDTRRLATRVELGDSYWSLVQRLADVRLVVTSHDALGQETVEIVHEALIRHWFRLHDWLSEDRAFRIWQERLRAGIWIWQDSDYDEGALLRGAALVAAENWLTERPENISPVEESFIIASAELRDQKQAEAEREQKARERLRRRFFLVLLVGFVVAVVLALAAGLQWRSAGMARDQAQAEANIRATAETVAIQEQTKAEEQTRLTRSRELALAALNSLDEDAERSILLALEALSIAHTQEAEQVLHQAVSADRLLLRMENGLQALQLAYSPDGSLLASTAWQGDKQGSMATVWDATNGEELFSLSPDYSVEDVVFSPDGRLVVTAGTSDTRVPAVQLWDASSGQERVSLALFGDEEQPPCQDGLAPGFYGLDISLDGRLLATIQCADGQYGASVWDMASGQALLDLADYTVPNWQRTIAFGQRGDAVAANTSESTATIWDTVTGEVLFVVSHEGGEITDIAFSPDGQYLVTGGHDGQAIIWDITTGEKILSIESGSPEVWAVAFGPDGELLATGAPNGSTKVWDVVTGEQLMTMNGAEERFWRVAFSPEGDRLATTSLAGETLVWDLNPGREFFSQAGQAGFEKVLLSPDGQRIVASDVNGNIMIWETGTGRQVLAWQAHEGVIEGLDISPDGQRLATGSADQTVKVWEIDTGNLLWTLMEHTDYVTHAAFSPDGEQLTTGAFDGMVGIWDMVSGQSVDTFALDLPVTSVAYDPDGERLVVTQMGTSSATIFEIESGEELLVLQDERFVDGIVDAVFSPDGRWVAISSFGGIVAVFDSQTGEQLISIDAHNAPIWGLAFSPDGTKLATGSVDGSARLWDAVTGELQLTLDDHGAAVAGLAFDSSGERLVTASYDNFVRGFILPLDQLLSLAESRLTRTFTGEECRQYRIDPCPANE